MTRGAQCHQRQDAQATYCGVMMFLEASRGTGGGVPVRRSRGGESGGTGGASVGGDATSEGGGGRGSSLSTTSPSVTGGGGGGGRSGVEERDVGLVGATKWAA